MFLKFKKSQEKLIRGFKKSNSGRNNQGRITVRYKGGCNKRKYRLVDFSYKNVFPISQVLKVEYDPYRTSHVCLIRNLITNQTGYILAPSSVSKGHLILSFKTNTRVTNVKFLNNQLTKILKLLYLKNLNIYNFIDLKFSNINFELLNYLFMKKRRFFKVPLLNKIGSVLPLFLIPKGEPVFNIENNQYSKGIFGRSAGVFATVVYQMGKNVVIKLPSGSYAVLNKNCYGVVGKVSNNWHNKKKLKKASSCYRRNKRPHVRGVAMNPVDHPHGGGEGKTSGGRPSVTPWGILTKGYKTTKKKTLDKHQLKELLSKSEKKNSNLTESKVLNRDKPLEKLSVYERYYLRNLGI